MTIKTKIFAGFSVLLSLALFLGGYNLLGYRSIGEAVESIEYSKFLALLEIQHRKWNEGLASVFLTEGQTEMTIELDHTKCRMGRFLYSEESQKFVEHLPAMASLLEELKPVHKDLHDSAREIGALWFTQDPQKQKEAQRIYQDKTLPSLSKIASLLNRMSEALEKIATGSAANLSDTVKGRTTVSGVLLVLIVLLGALAAVLIGRSITKALSAVIGDLNLASRSLTSAGKEIAGGSVQVAQGASEQAASLEETSSAMEELAAQSKDNADAAQHTFEAAGSMKTGLQTASAQAQNALHLSGEACDASERGVLSMQKISGSLKEIDQASQEVMDIIELINEITHETKMLATNAAIEAARAGEMGKGFAVVANEVSKLAENSKAAAKKINDIVRLNAQKAQSGKDQAEEGNRVLGEIHQLSTQAKELVAQIVQANQGLFTQANELESLAEQINRTSLQQSQGTSEVSRAIVEMDEITQSNASAAEQSASASEGLKDQSEALQATIDRLVQLIEGGDRRLESSGPSNPQEVPPAHRLRLPPA